MKKFRYKTGDLIRLSNAIRNFGSNPTQWFIYMGVTPQESTTDRFFYSDHALVLEVPNLNEKLYGYKCLVFSRDKPPGVFYITLSDCDTPYVESAKVPRKWDLSIP